MELVSVVIPVYNAERYLERCVRSVLEQSYPEVQVILVEDGSTDASPDLCDAWAGDRVQVIHQPNGGVASARNTGIAAASGEYILQLDSDDYLAPWAIEKLVHAARAERADMVICDFLKGEKMHEDFPLSVADRLEVIDRREAWMRIYRDDHSTLQYAAPWCKLCRRDRYEGIRYPDGKLFEDIATTHRLIGRCERIVVLDIPLFYYYQHPESIMNAPLSMKKLDYLQALEERVDFFAACGQETLERIAYEELLHALIWEYSRTRDILKNKAGMRKVVSQFRRVYRKGYSSRRYPQETARFLGAFARNPEWIILYWRLTGFLNRLCRTRKEETI